MKEWFINHSPNWLFKDIINLKGNAHIERISSANWKIYKDGMVLTSPTPKFIGFGLSQFENRYQKYFEIAEGDVVLDVGACIGDTTIPMMLKTGSDGKVIAVEPDPVNVKFLDLNINNFGELFHIVEIIQKAVWQERSTIEFNVRKAITGHSILLHPDSKITEKVEADTLDNLFGDRQIDFAKIDVQGAEVEVLNGGEHKFLGMVPKLIVGTHCKSMGYAKQDTYPDVMKILSKYYRNVKRQEHNVYASN